jgi:hypothetical protein
VESARPEVATPDAARLRQIRETYGPNQTSGVWQMEKDIVFLLQYADAQATELRTARNHSQCHDVVCNCDTQQHPRGAKGVGCSCGGRDTAYAELRTVRQERDDVARLCGSYSGIVEKLRADLTALTAPKE